MSTQLLAMAARVGWACATFDVPVEALPDRMSRDQVLHDLATHRAAMLAWADTVADQLGQGLPEGMTVAFVCDRRG